MKTCTKCSLFLPLEAFGPFGPSRPGKLRPECKTCKALQGKKQYHRNPDKARERAQAKYSAKPELYRAHKAASRIANPESHRESSRAWKSRNPASVQAADRKRHAAELKRTPPWADLDAIRQVYETAQRFRELGLEVHVDHAAPLQGRYVSGLHVHQNLQVLLAQDNLRKNNRFQPT